MGKLFVALKSESGDILSWQPIGDCEAVPDLTGMIDTQDYKDNEMMGIVFDPMEYTFNATLEVKWTKKTTLLLRRYFKKLYKTRCRKTYRVRAVKETEEQ